MTFSFFTATTGPRLPWLLLLPAILLATTANVTPTEAARSSQGVQQLVRTLQRNRLRGLMKDNNDKKQRGGAGGGGGGGNRGDDTDPNNLYGYDGLHYRTDFGDGGAGYQGFPDHTPPATTPENDTSNANTTLDGEGAISDNLQSGTAPGEGAPVVQDNSNSGGGGGGNKNSGDDADPDGLYGYDGLHYRQDFGDAGGADP